MKMFTPRTKSALNGDIFMFLNICLLCHKVLHKIKLSTGMIKLLHLKTLPKNNYAANICCADIFRISRCYNGNNYILNCHNLGFYHYKNSEIP